MKRLAITALTGAALGATALIGACDDETTATPPITCAPTNPACPALAVDSDCLALVDNAGKDKFALRLAQLSIKAPAALTGQIVYNIIADGVNINLESCNIPGMGSFSLITEFDSTTNIMTVGGAWPEEDPTAGFCYVHDSGNGIAPMNVSYTLDADGSLVIEPISRIVVPVFLDRSATSAVYLPLREANIVDGTVSANRNCIGHYNVEGLDPALNCAPIPEDGIEYFVNGAKLEGYITLEDADAINVDLLGQSLCVLLSNSPSEYGTGEKPNKCKRDGTGAIVLQGDWCSQTNSAGGCQDAFRLEADIASSAAAVRSTGCPEDPGGGGSGGSGGSAGGSGGSGGSAGGSGGSGGT